ncbi:unnamed protein product [Brachionus calyciflorus]|uniref:Uncharacterized protein n=1 Tax=Brachionus calyciflorus TaxID=104777 RepID=A0A814PJG0_9BILA|nr:unnamed protein product [Brachionus calyciflorus]
MLESFYSAYQKKVFTVEKPCPVKKTEILSYLRILHPIYSMSILTQRTDWHLGDVIPALIIILNGSLDENGLKGDKKKLVKNLKREIYKKFEFEINSKVYLAAGLLNISKLELWFEKEHVRRVEFSRKALMAFEDAILFIINGSSDDIYERPKKATKRSKKKYKNSENELLMSLVKSKSFETKEVVTNFNQRQLIKKEINDYLISIKEKTNLTKTTQRF